MTSSFTREVIGRILGEVGITAVTDAANGEEALAVLADTSRTVDLVLCDLRMPEMDGFAFLETVRRGERPHVNPFHAGDHRQRARRQGKRRPGPSPGASTDTWSSRSPRRR